MYRFIMYKANFAKKGKEPTALDRLEATKWPVFTGAALGTLAGGYGAYELGGFENGAPDWMAALPVAGMVAGGTAGFLPVYHKYVNQDYDKFKKELQAKGIKNPTDAQIAEHREDTYMRARGKATNRKNLEALRWSGVVPSMILARSLWRHPPEFISDLPDSINPEFLVPALAVGSYLKLHDYIVDKREQRYKKKGWI